MTAKKQDERRVEVVGSTTITVTIGDAELTLTGSEAADLADRLNDALYGNGVY